MRTMNAGTHIPACILSVLYRAKKCWTLSHFLVPDRFWYRFSFWYRTNQIPEVPAFWHFRVIYYVHVLVCVDFHIHDVHVDCFFSWRCCPS